MATFDRSRSTALRLRNETTTNRNSACACSARTRLFNCETGGALSVDNLKLLVAILAIVFYVWLLYDTVLGWL